MKIKNNQKGYSLIDVTVAILVITIFTGIIASLFVQISYNSSMIQLQSVAYNYAIRVLELTDRLPYKQVDETLNETIKDTLQIAENFDMQIQVTNYKGEYSAKKDLIKTVNVTVTYSFQNEKFTINLAKLKIREPQESLI